MLPFLYKFFLLALPVIISGCTVPANQPPLSGDLASRHLESRPPITGGRIHFWLGKTYSGGLLFSEIDTRQPANLMMDGRNLGGVNYGEVLVFELPSGRYRFAWSERSNTSSALQSSNIEVTVQNGDLIYLRTYSNVASVAQFGLLGAAVSPPTATLQHILNGGPQMISRLRPVGVVGSDLNTRFIRAHPGSSDSR